MSERTLKLHNAMWPGLVGKGEPGTEPAISMQRMLELTAAAEVEGHRFDGVDFFLYEPHFDIHGSEDAIRRVADQIASYGFKVGSLVAPIWPGTLGASSMGSADDRKQYLKAIEAGCRAARIFNEHGVRQYGSIRIDSAASPVEWAKDPVANTKRIAQTFSEAAVIAEAHGERLVAEGEVCWAGMHSWKDMLNLLEAVGRPDVLGFQADLAHTYLYLLGVNAPEHALLKKGYTEVAFWSAYKQMTDALGPWLMDFHIAQSDGTVHGSGSHDKTGRHCAPDDSNGKLDMTTCSLAWLLDDDGNLRNGIKHICWDGCMFSNATLENPNTWNSILTAMLDVKNALTPAASNHE